MDGEPPPAPERLEAADWARLLAAGLGCPVRVSYGRSRSAPIQGRPLPAGAGSAVPGVELRLHGIFREAPPDVREAVMRWLRSGRRARRASELLDRWITERLARLPQRATRLAPRGASYDLRRLRDELVAERFPEELEAPPAITWGRRGRTAARWSLRLGTYYPEHGLISVHTVLDQPAVPEWFLRFVVFHELLHAALPSEPAAGGRVVYHTATFRAREREYPDYERAVAWEERHLPRLIRSARTGEALELPREKARAAHGFRQGLLFPEMCAGTE